MNSAGASGGKNGHAQPKTPAPAKAAGPAMPLAERLKHERELLGFYVSGHPMNAYAGLDELLDTLTEASLATLRDRTPFRLCGVVTTIVKRISKRDNRPWATFTLATRRGNFSINVFTEGYEKYQALLADGTIVVVHGEARHDELRNEKKLNAQELASLDERLPGLLRGIQWVLRPEPSSDEFLRLLGERAHKMTGATANLVSFWQGGGHVLQFDLPTLPKLRFDASAYHALRRHPAVHGVVLDIVPPPAPESRWPRNGR